MNGVCKVGRAVVFGPKISNGYFTPHTKHTNHYHSNPMSGANVKLVRFLRMLVDEMREKGRMKELVIAKPGESDLVGILDLDDTMFECETQVRRRSFDSLDTAKKFTQLIAIAGVVSELIQVDQEISLRDVYYSLKPLFRAQAQCNGRILELGTLLGLKRYDMGIVPSAKGIVAGTLLFKFEDVDPWTACYNSPAEDGGISIESRWTSCNNSDLSLRLSDTQTRYLIVVEKEGVFRRLVKDHFCRRVPCVLVTGCGFPDMATRALVAKVASTFPDLQVVGLCDYNPYGVALLLSYRFASQASAYEGEGLQADDLKWLGLRPSQMDVLREESGFDETSAFQPMSSADKKKLRSLLGNGAIHGLPAYQDELHAMRDGDFKCELEILYTLGPTYLSDFLEAALTTDDFI